MTTADVIAHFERQQAEARATADRFDRLADASEQRAAELLSAVAAPPLPPAPPPAPPAAPSPGPDPWPRGRPAHGLTPAQVQQAARQAELRARREQYQREQAERAWRNSQPPKSPPVRTGRR